MSAGESITRIGRLLKSMMMQMRQKNLFVIVILPTVFELSRYSVLGRARCMFHIYEKSGRMGYWVGYNRKAMKQLFLKGKKTYSYKVRSLFNGRFYGKYVVNEELYRKKKGDALFLLDDDNKEEKLSPRAARQMKQRDALIEFLRNNGCTIEKVQEILNKKGLSLDMKQISMAAPGIMMQKIRAERKRVENSSDVPIFA